MARKFDKTRFNKLVEKIVIIITLISAVYFIYLLTRDGAVNQTYLERIRTCGTGDEVCYAIWHGYLNDFREAQKWSLIVGLGLPSLFFGGKALINYLAPEQKEK